MGRNDPRLIRHLKRIEDLTNDLLIFAEGHERDISALRAAQSRGAGAPVAAALQREASRKSLKAAAPEGGVSA